MRRLASSANLKKVGTLVGTLAFLGLIAGCALTLTYDIKEQSNVPSEEIPAKDGGFPIAQEPDSGLHRFFTIPLN